MATHSSRMLALTSPARFGLEVVRVFFGEIRPDPHQVSVISGDLVRLKGLGALARPQVFVAYENGQVLLRPYDEDDGDLT